ncbi:MAG: FAD-dependent monooxygenase, partial [Pseudomonadota bacterium]
VAAETREDVVTLIGGAGEQVSGDIVIGADGRNSIVRQSVGIAVKSWAYEQVAVACQFAHSAPHDNISTEFHRAAGPLTVVPGAPDASGDAEHVSHLVWIETPDVAASLAALDDAAFSRSLSRHLQGLLGAIGPLGPRGCFPISGAHAQRYATDRVILAGEAAHVLPPIGAQGMNLGMRDVLALIELLGPADVSIADAVQRYDSARRSDAYVRTTGVDLLNRSLTTRHWPLQALRGAGLHAIGALPALKRAVISAGFGGGVSPDAQTRGESN